MVPYFPLQYPGSKRWLSTSIHGFMPPDIDEIVSPFFGGGFIEITLARRGLKVYGGDLFEPLVNFWQYFLAEPQTFLEKAKRVLEENDKIYFKVKRKTFYETSDPELQAIHFFLLNRMTYGGASFYRAGLYSDFKRCLKDMIFDELTYQFESLSENIEIETRSFEETLEKYPKIFAICDPPYPTDSKGLYGVDESYHEEFKHLELFDRLKDRKNWILTYPNSNKIRHLYKDFEIIELHRASRIGQTDTELLIRN